MVKKRESREGSGKRSGMRVRITVRGVVDLARAGGQQLVHRGPLEVVQVLHRLRPSACQNHECVQCVFACVCVCRCACVRLSDLYLTIVTHGLCWGLRTAPVRATSVCVRVCVCVCMCVCVCRVYVRAVYLCNVCCMQCVFVQCVCAMRLFSVFECVCEAAS